MIRTFLLHFNAQVSNLVVQVTNIIKIQADESKIKELTEFHLKFTEILSHFWSSIESNSEKSSRMLELIDQIRKDISFPKLYKPIQEAIEYAKNLIENQEPDKKKQRLE